MQRNFHAVPVDGLAIAHALHVHIAKPFAQDRDAIFLAKVRCVAPTRVIRVAVSDDRAFDGAFAPMLRFVLTDEKLSEKDKAELRQMLARSEKRVTKGGSPGRA